MKFHPNYMYKFAARRGFLVVINTSNITDKGPTKNFHAPPILYTSIKSAQCDVRYSVITNDAIIQPSTISSSSVS